MVYVSALTALLFAGTPSTKVLRAHPRGASTIVVDGVLDEPVWGEADVAGDFVERDPEPGVPAAAKTEIRVLYDEGNLYVGVVLHTLEGEVPRALELQRDALSILDDDSVSLKFDVRLDRRTTAGFVTNPAGASLDYIVVENGRLRREHDAVWSVRTTVLADRWIAEVEIPSAALGLAGIKGRRAIGFNVTRTHNHRLAVYDWSETPPEFGEASALHYGLIDDLVDVAGGRTLSLVPYVLARHVSLEEDPLAVRAGGDIRLRVAGDAWVELTLLNDFAEVDLDTPVLNFDRFPLFFPEKRPFFLSGLDVFELGALGFAQPFFSRRIGLDEDADVVPLYGGLKAYGSAGDLRFGVLEVVTGEYGQREAESFTVGRVRYNWGEHGHAGLIATFAEDSSSKSGGFDPRATLGFDGAVRAFEKRLQVSGFWSGTNNDTGDETSRGQAGKAELAWLGEEVQPRLSITYISPTYDPAIGFVARTDIVRSRTDLLWVVRPNAMGLRNISAGAAGQLDHDFDLTSLMAQELSSFFSLTFDNGWLFGSSVSLREDFVRDAFEVVPGREVLPGRYRGPDVFLDLITPAARNPAARLSYRFNGALFGGNLHSFRASGTARVGAHLTATGEADYSIVTFDDFLPTRTFVGRAVIEIVPSTAIGIDLIVQGNALEDSAEGFLRLRWQFSPGSDVFFVYRECLDFGGEDITSERTLTLKIAYRYDTLL